MYVAHLYILRSLFAATDRAARPSPPPPARDVPHPTSNPRDTARKTSRPVPATAINPSARAPA